MSKYDDLIESLFGSLVSEQVPQQQQVDPRTANRAQAAAAVQDQPLPPHARHKANSTLKRSQREQDVTMAKVDATDKKVNNQIRKAQDQVA